MAFIDGLGTWNQYGPKPKWMVINLLVNYINNFKKRIWPLDFPKEMVLAYAVKRLFTLRRTF